MEIILESVIEAVTEAHVGWDLWWIAKDRGKSDASVVCHPVISFNASDQAYSNRNLILAQANPSGIAVGLYGPLFAVIS